MLVTRMSLQQRVLGNRKNLWMVTLLCVFETLWSWASVVKDAGHRAELTTATFVLVLASIAAGAALRSSFWTDRIVFGAMAAAGILISVRALPLSPAAMLAVAVAKSSMWTIGSVVSVFVLAGPQRRTG